MRISNYSLLYRQNFNFDIANNINDDIEYTLP